MMRDCVLAAMLLAPCCMGLSFDKNPFVLAAYVVPDQPASKDLLSQWEDVEMQVPSTSTHDCAEAPDECANMGVFSFPTIRLHMQDEPRTIRYRGPRKASSIVAFTDRVLRPVVSNVDAADLEEFSKVDDITIVAHVAPGDEGFMERFTAVAAEYRDRMTFGVVEAPVSQASDIKCSNWVESKQHTVKDVDRVGALETLVKKCAEPSIPSLSRRNELEFMSSGKSLLFYFTDDEKDRDDFVHAMRPLAQAVRDVMHVLTVDSHEYADMPRTVGIAGSRGLSLRNTRSKQVFPYRGAMVPSDVQQFLIDVSQGVAKPWDRSVAEADQDHDEL